MQGKWGLTKEMAIGAGSRLAPIAMPAEMDRNFIDNRIVRGIGW